MIERDKRVFERIPAMIDVAYRIHKGEDYNRTISKDISGGGISLSLNEKINIGIPLELKITLPNTDVRIPALGKVIWTIEVVIQTNGFLKFYNTGIEFININIVCLGKVYRYFYEQTMSDSLFLNPGLPYQRTRLVWVLKSKASRRI